MTTSHETTLASWLLPGSRETRLRLDTVVTEAAEQEEIAARRLRVLGAVAKKALVEEIEAKLRTLLSDTLADLVIGGWRAYGAIRAAIRKSHDQPGVDQVVPLHNHRIQAEREHDLDVAIDGFHVMTLTARLEATLQIYDAVAVIRDGHLLAVRSGQAHATGLLDVGGAEVARRTLRFPLTAELTLHRPINMSDPSDGPTFE
jgi:hypothetical protein